MANHPANQPEPNENQVGTYFLGRYRVVDEIGIGGMASVHLARMDGPGGFQKWVAIKRIHSHLIEDESFVQMFLDEARVAAQISHPNVATVFDLGRHADTYWIAMEYLHGEPLREVMRRTEELGAPMPPEIACRVIADAAEGLHAAHELRGKQGETLNLVHRDVTPHNLFVTYDGNTKVVDFGIAKFSSRMSSTRAGTLKGKLAYMSPEQVHGEAIDRRTDIFALGVVLWELTTGQRLFRMETDLDTLAKVQECNVPRPSTLVRGFPLDLENIILKTLAKNRNERFATARELSRALQTVLMRRGFFVASDEVSQYVRGIFRDRMEHREAHLRWAAEVTQTINFDQLKAQQGQSAEYLSASSLESYSSADPGAAGGPPRPAAGAPPPRPAAALPAAGRAPEPRVTSRPPVQQAGQLGSAHLAQTATPSDLPKHTGETPHIENFYDDGPTIQGTSLGEEGAPGAIPKLNDSGEFDDAAETIVQTSPEEAATAEVGSLGHLAPAFPAPPGGALAAAASAPSVDPLAPTHFASRPMLQTGDLAMAPNPFADNRTVTARRRPLPVPIWVVGVGSGVIALVVAMGLYMLIARLTDTGDDEAREPVVAATSPESTGAPDSTATGATPAAAGADGPFSSARDAFNQAIAPAGAVAPEPTAPPTPTAPEPKTTAAAEPTASAAPTAKPDPTTAKTSTPAATTKPTSHASHSTTHTSTKPSSSGTTGLLTVICTPKCAHVYDNGTDLGASPIYRKRVKVGEHRLKLQTSKPPITKVVSVIVVKDELNVKKVRMSR